MINDENTFSAANRAKSAAPTGAKAKKGKTIEETYTKKSQLEHILLRPDTYIGAVEKQTQPMWVLDEEAKQIVSRPISYVPGLYKIFDEIMVNAADNKQRDPTMNRIEVTIDAEEGFIRVWNNGSGIPIAVHQEHGIYVPELIFGNLLTGSNFDDNEQKTTGGRNGFGAKLANIFSTRFVVETTDNSRSLKYRQEFTDNMTVRHEPAVQKSTGADCTCITFYPDLQRFKMDCLDADTVALLSKRVYDIAGTNNGNGGSKLNVYLNGSRIEVKNFEQYISLYQGIEPPAALERVNDRWEIGVGVSDGSFQQISFVNSICTMKGGCHVGYIADQITNRLMPIVKKKNKGEEVKANQIKNHLAIFVNALVVNPAFDSQTKENLTTKSSSFGSTCTVSDKMIKQVEKSGVIDNILNWAKFKQTAELKKKSGSKRSKLIGITKLDDANFAGTAKSSQCTLILTEGDSAKALAISGLGVVGRDYYGVFPLKGKLLNVREASHQQIMKNEEVQNITKIIGLTFGKVYHETSSLRYGHVLIMTDQDHDGSHIKGLLINFIHHFWPSLLQLPQFLQQFITPIVKCTKGSRELSFYTIPEYQKWREEQAERAAAANGGGSAVVNKAACPGWRIKYYKGLGTSTAAEAKEYFSNLPTHKLDFAWDDRAADVIDMAFAKKRVEDRKLWLLSKEQGVHIDYNVDEITYDNFVNQELILFSYADNERSIPHFMDGLKPSQRKVLYSCFKRNLKQEIKVAQLAGYVSEHSAYHHGEASLTQTIIGMAQNFVGSNNINLLSPCGQFGTRLMGGKDAASPRYVFTKLEAIARHIFHPNDDPLLEYLDDDGQNIEPVHYVPVIPLALVNGSEGIGTGWSSSIPNYNPRDIISVLRGMISGEIPAERGAGDAMYEMDPWYRGFTGSIEAKTGKDCNNYTVHGTLELVDDNTVVISELPVGRWTTDYKQFLESMVVGATNAAPATNAGDAAAAAAAGQPFIKDFKENHTDTTVLFTVNCVAGKLAEFAAAPGGLQKKFKLDGSIATSNMNMFDLNAQIKKFEGPKHLVQEFFGVRMMYYDRRKEYLAGKLTEEWEKLDNKMRFVLAVVNGELVVANRKKGELLEELRQRGFKTFYERKNNAAASAEEVAADGDESPAEGSSSNSNSLGKGYDYLLSMKLWSLTMERVQELIQQRNTKKEELEELLSKSAEQLWLEDLDALEAALDEFEGAREEEKRQEAAARRKANTNNTKSKQKAGRAKAAKPVKKSKAVDSDDDSCGDDSDDNDGDDSDFEISKPKKKSAPAARGKGAPAASKPRADAAPKQVMAQKRAAPAAAPVRAPATAAAAPAKDPLEGLSLFERLRLKKEAAAAGKSDPFSKAAPSKPPTAASTVVDLCDDAPASARSAAAVDIDLTADSEDENVGTKPTAKLQKSAAGGAGGKKAVADRAPLSVLSSPSAPTAGQKRAKKSTIASTAHTFSPGVHSPQVNPSKRSKPAAAAAAARKMTYATGAGAAKRAASKGSRSAAAAADSLLVTAAPAASAATKGAKAPKRATNRRLIPDDDDEEAEFDDPVVVPTKSPKPVRARKVLSYKDADESIDEDESEEEEEFDEDDDDSDFEDSD